MQLRSGHHSHLSGMMAQGALNKVTGPGPPDSEMILAPLSMIHSKPHCCNSSMIVCPTVGVGA